jgi:serine/threonine-protein kinase
MTEVYAARLAEEVGPGRLLVIKILPKSLKDDPAAEARFLEEARIILNITHGNITAAFEFGREDGRPFLVMEYVPGPSLRRLLDSRTRNAGRQLNLQDSLFISREVCRALSYAHSFSDHTGSGKGIIHRDLSPGNILISTTGQVKLSDFGIAEFMHGGFFGPVWGKAPYVAPEVASGSAPSPASDLYSLGTVLYECLTGVPPILGENDKETLKLVTTVQPEPPSAIRT